MGREKRPGWIRGEGDTSLVLSLGVTGSGGAGSKAKLVDRIEFVEVDRSLDPKKASLDGVVGVLGVPRFGLFSLSSSTLFFDTKLNKPARRPRCFGLRLGSGSGCGLESKGIGA